MDTLGRCWGRSVLDPACCLCSKSAAAWCCTQPGVAVTSDVVLSVVQPFGVRGSEQMTLIASESYIGYTFDIIDRALGSATNKLAFVHGRDSVIKGASTASHRASCRPDSWYCVDRRLVLVGVERVTQCPARALQFAALLTFVPSKSDSCLALQPEASGLTAARKDLGWKSISLSATHYGDVKYIMAYAASGPMLQYFYITTDGHVSHSLQQRLDATPASSLAHSYPLKA